MLDFFIASVSWLFMLLLQIVGIVLGLVLVPFGLLFRKKNPETQTPFTVYPEKDWVYEDLPSWLLPWQNKEDGLRGDKRGWWDQNCFFKDSSHPLNMFWWSGIRNPFNYFKRFILGCDIREYFITKLAGQDYVRDDLKSTGWQLLKASPLNNSSKWLPRYTFYGVWRYGSSTRALVVQLGNKIKLDHNSSIEKSELDYFKGFTFEINVCKDIS